MPSTPIRTQSQPSERWPRRLAPHLPADNFRVEAIEQITFPDASADVVLSSAVLHFARDDEQFDGDAQRQLEGAEARRACSFAGSPLQLAWSSAVKPIAGRRHRLPDGSERYLVDAELLTSLTRELGGELLDPLKTTVVQDQRCMTTWVVRKEGPPAS